MQLTQKETSYLKDAEHQEQLCVSLYQQHSQIAEDPELAQLLQTIGSQEQQHLQTIKQLQQGRIPSNASSSQSMTQPSGFAFGGQQQPGRAVASVGGIQTSGMQMQSQTSQSVQGGSQPGQQSPDRQACQELLSIEKSVSDLYDHAVFESTNQQARQALEHIQQEEHQHGFMLWQYMNKRGWYQAQ